MSPVYRQALGHKKCIHLAQHFMTPIRQFELKIILQAVHVHSVNAECPGFNGSPIHYLSLSMQQHIDH